MRPDIVIIPNILSENISQAVYTGRPICNLQQSDQLNGTVPVGIPGGSAGGDKQVSYAGMKWRSQIASSKLDITNCDIK